MSDALIRLLAAFIATSSYTLMPYFVIATLHRFNVKKEYANANKQIIKVSIPPKFKQKYDDIQLDKIDNRHFKKAAVEFAKVLVEHFPEEALTNLYNNLNEVKIRKNIVISFFGLGGVYKVTNNSMSLSRSDCIYHELFHMASASYDKESETSYVGFRYSKSDISIGKGINEGYTEVLTHRYFPKKTPESYMFETDIARKLETIIGTDKMILLYFRGDLLGLISELSNYMPEEEIMKFLKRVDFINGYYDDLGNTNIRESIFDIYEFLLKTYALKLKKQYEEGLINIDTFCQLSTDYLKSFKDNARFSLKNYKLRNIYKMYEIILKDISVPEEVSRCVPKP